MSWQFQSPFLKLVNGTLHKIGKFTSATDVSATRTLLKTINGTTYYLPLFSGTSTSATGVYRYCINGSVYYPHANKITCTVAYTRNTYSPTSGVYQYYWKITSIGFESSLPVSSSFYTGSLSLKSVSANTKKITGSPVFQTPIQNGSTFTVYFKATNAGITVTGSFTMGASGSRTFIIS